MTLCVVGGQAPRDLDRLRHEATQLRAGLRYGRPPVQQAALTEDERRERSSTKALWPRFISPEQRR